MSRTLAAGLALTLIVTGALVAGWGRAALLPGVSTGLMAVVIQVLAVRALRGGLATETTAGFFKGFGVGMLLRALGVGLVLAAVLVDRGHFPPLPTAFGYLGVIIPLLFLEVRFVR